MSLSNSKLNKRKNKKNEKNRKKRNAFALLRKTELKRRRKKVSTCLKNKRKKWKELEDSLMLKKMHLNNLNKKPRSQNKKQKNS